MKVFIDKLDYHYYMTKFEFKDRLRELRREKKLSQAQLARLLNLDVMLISRWERGANYPSLVSIKLLVEFFGCTAGYLIGTEN